MFPFSQDMAILVRIEGINLEYALFEFLLQRLYFGFVFLLLDHVVIDGNGLID
jgi:hypothetical protein